MIHTLVTKSNSFVTCIIQFFCVKQEETRRTLCVTGIRHLLLQHVRSESQNLVVFRVAFSVPMSHLTCVTTSSSAERQLPKRCCIRRTDCSVLWKVGAFCISCHSTFQRCELWVCGRLACVESASPQSETQREMIELRAKISEACAGNCWMIGCN